MLTTRIIHILFAFTITSFPLSLSAKSAPTSVTEDIKRIAQAFPGNVGLYAYVVGKHPHAVALNANKRYPMASTYKIPLMLQVYRDIDAGRLKMRKKIRITQKQLVPYGLIPYMTLPKTFTVQDLLLLMISLSDNTATDLLFSAVHIKRIQKTLRQLHLSDIHVNRSVANLIDDWDNGDQGLFAKDPRDTATPKAMAKLLGLIAMKKAASRSSCQKMLTLMRHQKINTRIPMYLPHVVLGHKTGSLGYWRNDVGYMKIKNHYIALAIFTTKKNLQQPNYHSNIVIGKIARRLFDYYSGLYA